MKKKAFLLIIICFLSISIFAQSIEQRADSLKLLIENATEDTTKALLRLKLESFFLYKNPRKSIEGLHSSLAFAKKIGFDKAVAYGHTMLFNAHDVLGTHTDTLLYYNQLLEKYVDKNKDDFNRHISLYWNYGIYYRKLGEHDKVIAAQLKAFELIKKYRKEDKHTQAKILSNIAGTLRQSYNKSNHLEALKYYKQALALIENTTDYGLISLNIGTIYSQKLNSIDSALIFFEKAHEIFEKNETHSGTIRVMIEKGICYDKIKDVKNANRFYKEASRLIKEYNINEDLMLLYEALAGHHQLKEEYQLAIKYSDMAIKGSAEKEDYRFLAVLYKIQSASYVAIGDFENAYKVKELLIAQNDSINSIELQSKLQELQTKFNTEQTKLENELLKAEKIKAMRGRTSLVIGIVAISLLLGGWSIFSYRLNQQRKAQNELLAKDLKNKKTIETQAEKLQVLYDYKNKLFANIAHELRTPLTLIRNPIKAILQSETIADNHAQQLHIVDRNVRSLSSSIYQILDLAKRDNIELVTQPISFDVNRLVHFIASDFRSMAQFKSIHFTKPSISASIPVITDGEKLMIVIRNLLSNAFKFTQKKGQVNIHIIDLGEEVAISVQDTGKGISAKNLEKIFNRHFQVNPVNLPNEGGMGIGLAICKEYMTLINGSIYAESQPDKGSTFSIRFPKKISKTVTINDKANQAFNTLITPINIQNVQQKELVTTKSLTATEITGEVSTILIVEDNVDMSNYLMSILSEEHELYFTQDGQEALQFLENRENQRPDLIISDYMMPNMNGLEFIDKLKKHNDYAQIPVVMLTAQQAVDVKLNALRIGVDDYLTKPFDNRELVARVNNILINQRIIRAEQQREQIETTPESDDNSVLKTNLKDLEWLSTLEVNALKHVYNLNFTLNQLADEMAMSYSGLFPKIKKLTGMTPNQYITELRFQEARKLLEAHKYGSVKAVAYSVGYKSVKHFSKNFKKRFGKSPSAYLNEVV